MSTETGPNPTRKTKKDLEDEVAELQDRLQQLANEDRVSKTQAPELMGFGIC